MTQPAKESRSGLGPMLILFILLVDVGLAIWGWHLYQRKQERLDDAGLQFREEPDDPSAHTRARRAEPLMPASSMDLLVKEPENPAGRTRPAATTAPGGESTSPERRQKVAKAVKFFFDLKKSARFKESKVLQEWKKDFLADPDLRAVNDRYRKDGDAIRFVVHMAQAPGFKTLVAKHLQSPDMAAFLGAMTSNKEVMQAATEFTSDANVNAAVKHLGLKAGTQAEPIPTLQAPEQRRSLLNDPALKRQLEGMEGSGVRLD